MKNYRPCYWPQGNLPSPLPEKGNKRHIEPPRQISISRSESGLRWAQKHSRGPTALFHTVGAYLQGIQGFELNALRGGHDGQNPGKGEIDSAARQGARYWSRLQFKKLNGRYSHILEYTQWPPYASNHPNKVHPSGEVKKGHRRQKAAGSVDAGSTMANESCRVCKYLPTMYRPNPRAVRGSGELP